MYGKWFENKHLKNCRWSKDPRKRYNQLKHFYDNCNKYDINVNDLISISELKKDCYKQLKRK